MKVFTALYLLSIAAVARAFVPTGRSSARPAAAAALNANPIETLFSVMKEGKVGLVKSLAGEYDAAAIRSRMDSDISKEPVLMYSFTT